MEDLEDELDLRYHKGINPDVYYRCPTLESLYGALRNEIEKSASSLIPTEIVTEFIFATASTITIPVTQQPHLDALIEPADYAQSIPVEYALCHGTTGRPRLKAQRAIARSMIDAIQDVDRFRYVERSAHSREGGDGMRFKYICQESAQHRQTLIKKEKSHATDDDQTSANQMELESMPMSDCGGAIHIKFSTKRDAIHLVYKHNPIHGDAPPSESTSIPSQPQNGVPLHSTALLGSKEAKKKSRSSKNGRKSKIHVDIHFQDSHLDVSTSPDAPRSAAQRKRKPVSLGLNRKTSTKKSKKGVDMSSPTRSQKQATVHDTSLPPQPIRGKACIRCREKEIKCNETKPTCNQCKRGLWTCQYEAIEKPKRSKTGCINCKQRGRRCTEEKPSCAYCLRVDDDCEYAESS